MLIRKDDLERIKEGEIDLAFRRQKRPTIRAGGTLKTRIGVLAIGSVREVSERSITAADARRAGCASLSELLDKLRGREGVLYRIELRYAGEDPRIALRNEYRVGAAELAEIREQLVRFDKASRRGPWTRETLTAIARYPGRRAIELAEAQGHDKPWFKAQVRKLKALGLTISLSPGYELSPRGKVVLQSFRGEQGG